MKKIVVALVCGLICVAAIVSAAVCSTRADYAKEHYENNYVRDSGELLLFLPSGYGCGDNDCEYCNGGQYKKSLDEFVYLNSMNNGKTASTIVAVVFGIATLALSVWAFLPKKADEKTNTQHSEQPKEIATKKKA